MVDYTFNKLWKQQEEYNRKIKASNASKTSEYWMTNYILGTISELGELMEEINWKSHRSTPVRDMGSNVTDQLADITKYVFSMWQLLGATENDLIYHTYQKGELLEQLLRQEHSDPPAGERIIIVDMDGVIADFRLGFFDWVKTSKWSDILLTQSDQIGLHLDLNNGWDYMRYEEAKIEFEKQGGYRKLPAVTGAMEVISALKLNDWRIVVYTARPYTVYRRIWIDTWNWLQENKFPVDELHFGQMERVLYARSLDQNNLVVALEDDPTIIRRYVTSNIPVFVIDQPYNQDIYSNPWIYKIMNFINSYSVFELINRHQYTRI